MNLVRGTVWVWRQAPTRVRVGEILMVERVEHFPAKFEVPALRDMELQRFRRAMPDYR